jgi:hypothetical protein
MANHVSGYITLENASEEGQKVWDTFVLGTIAENRDNYETHLGHFLFEEKDGEFVDWDFNRMCEEVGAKWAYATDADESGFAYYSAWSPLNALCEMISQKIGEVDKDFRLIMTYEDEMPNFVGCAIYDHSGQDEEAYMEHDDLLQLLMEEDAELKALYDEDEGDWKDGKEEEAWEILHEIQYDFISDWQSKFAYGE